VVLLLPFWIWVSKPVFMDLMILLGFVFNYCRLKKFHSHWIGWVCSCLYLAFLVVDFVWNWRLGVMKTHIVGTGFRVPCFWFGFNCAVVFRKSEDERACLCKPLLNGGIVDESCDVSGNRNCLSFLEC